MKKLILLIFVLFLFSCDENTKVVNPDAKTTLELQSKIDSVSYKYVYVDNDKSIIYVFDKDKKVVEIANERTNVLSLFMFTTLVFIILFVLAIVVLGH